MATFDAVDKYFSGQGVVMLGDRDATTGDPTGLVAIGNVSELKISIATSILEHKESHTGQRGTDLRLTTELKTTLSMTMESWVSSNLADALRGTHTVVAASSVANQAQIFYAGKIINLPHVNISNLVVTGTGGTPVFVLDTDYTENLAAGSFKLADTVATMTELDPLMTR
jgi:hypothetical protein